MRTFAVLLACCFVATSCSVGAGTGPDGSTAFNANRAMAVLGRTKTFEGTYSLYIWNRITRPGSEPVEEWSAEFHSGSWHRVETPRDRVVANCETGTGLAFSVETEEFFEGPEVAHVACGINTNIEFESIEWLGRVRTALGAAERIRVVDRDNVRDYDVSETGILFATTYAENRPGRHVSLIATGIKLESVVPDLDMFDRASLLVSFVPDKYRVKPKP